MTEEQMVAAFNEWMRRFTEEPEQYCREFETVHQFLCDVSDGEVPSYGVTSAAYMKQLVSELGL